MANGRQSKNYIPSIKHGQAIITDQVRKEEVITDAFENLLGTAHARNHTLDWDYLGIQPLDLQYL